MNKQTARLNEIIKFLTGAQLTTVSHLAEHCSVSEVTMRRDLKQLQDDGLVNTVNGAVSLNMNSEGLRIGDKYYISQQAERNKAAKQRIAQKAVSFLEPHDTIVVDVGSTPYFFARAIPQDLPLTVICYSLNAFIELHDREACSIIFAGGFFHRNSLICESPEGISLVQRLRVQKAFMGATGVHTYMGVTSSNHSEQGIKQAAIASSLSRFLLVDSSKFGKVKTAFFTDIEDFQTVITDSGIPSEYERTIRDAGCQLEIA